MLLSRIIQPYGLQGIGSLREGNDGEDLELERYGIYKRSLRCMQFASSFERMHALSHRDLQLCDYGMRTFEHMLQLYDAFSH